MPTAGDAQMQGEPLFLGIYANSAEVEAGGGQTAARWHAWGLPDGSFLMQKILTDGRDVQLSPPKPARISAEDFFTNFRVFAAFSARYNPVFPREPSEWLDQAQETSSAENETDRSANERTAPVQPERAISVKPAAAPAQPAREASITPERAAQTPAEDKPRSFADFLAMSVAEEAGLEQGAGQNLEQSGNYVIVKGRAEEKSGYRFRSFSMKDYAPAHYGPVEMSVEEAAQIEENFLADFSMAIIKLRDKQNEALRNMQDLAGSSGPFARDHKFMFTDCGLALRKRNFYALAELFHERARGLAPQDEHVLFNLARVMYESGRMDKAREYLNLSLELNPDFEAGKDFLAFMDGLSLKSMQGETKR